MSSELELSHSSESSKSTEDEDMLEEEEGDVAVIYSQVTPYEDEPLADVETDAETDEDEEETDLDGLTPAVLEARYEREIPLDSWYV